MSALPKSRGQKAYRLAREDLAPRRASTNMDDFDFACVAPKYSPHRFSADQIPEIPVYNREKNTIRRFSRIVSSPEQSSLAYLSSHRTSQHAPATTSQPMHENATTQQDIQQNTQQNIQLNQNTQHNIQQNIQQDRPNDRLRQRLHEPLPNRPEPESSIDTLSTSSTLSSNLSSKGSSRIHDWINRRSSPLRNTQPKRYSRELPSLPPNNGFDVVEHFQPAFSIHREGHERHSSNGKEFPKFVPQYQTHFRSRSGQQYMPESTGTRYHEPLKTEELKAVPRATYASSGASTYASRRSENTYASSETEMSSVEMCEPVDIASYYEKAGEVRSFHDDSLFEEPKPDSLFEHTRTDDRFDQECTDDSLFDHAKTDDSLFEDNLDDSSLEQSLHGHHSLKQPKTHDLFAQINQMKQIEDAPPVPPKHQRRVVSEIIPRKQNLRQSSSTVPSFDYCLDLGADYERSRFMIPEENCVARPHRSKNEIVIRKRAPGEPLKDSASSSVKSDRRSVSSRERVFSGLKSGFGRIIGEKA